MNYHQRRLAAISHMLDSSPEFRAYQLHWTNFIYHNYITARYCIFDSRGCKFSKILQVYSIPSHSWPFPFYRCQFFLETRTRSVITKPFLSFPALFSFEYMPPTEIPAFLSSTTTLLIKVVLPTPGIPVIRNSLASAIYLHSSKRH